VKKIEGFVFGACLLTVLSSFAAGQQTYSYGCVKVPNSSPFTPTGINNAGQVLADQVTSTSASMSLWNLTGNVEGVNTTGANDIGAAINANNDVAGTGTETVGGNPQAFLWQANDSTTNWLGTLGGATSAANAVNDKRQVVGVAFTGSGQRHAFLWSADGGMQDLTPDVTSPGGSVATGINSAGEVVGYYYPNGATNVVGFSWTSAGGLKSFGTPGTLAFAINDAGTIVGRTETASGWQAFTWTSAGGFVYLGTLGGTMSTGLSINNNGWVVGTSLATPNTGMLKGFLWTPTGGMQNLSTVSNCGGMQPYSIQVNDYGDIALSFGTQVELLAPKMTAQVTPSENPLASGNSVTFTTTLSSIAGPPPNGESIQCSVAGTVVSTGTLKGGAAQCNISGLSSGRHTVTVTYPGDVYFQPIHVNVTEVVN
jgi:probable HAF family extracellular repeat protein